MAKVSITVEIDGDTMDVTINGKKIVGVNYVSCYTYDDAYDMAKKVSCNISTLEKDEESGVAKTTNYYTMSSKEGKSVAKAEAILDIPEFIGKIETDPTEAISKLLTSKISKHGV